MPFYTAQYTFSIDFRLLASVQTIKDSQSRENKLVDDYACGRDDGFKEEYAEWLVEEAIRQAEGVVKNNVIVAGADPLGVTISEHGFDCVYVDEEISNWRELYKDSPNGELDQSYMMHLVVSANSSADIRLHKNKNDEALYDEADSRGHDIKELLTNMITLAGDLPSGWQIVGEFEVEVDNVSAYEHKKWWEKTPQERRRNIPRLIKRQTKQSNYRRR